MACRASSRPKPVEHPVMNQTGGSATSNLLSFVVIVVSFVEWNRENPGSCARRAHMLKKRKNVCAPVAEFDQWRDVRFGFRPQGNAGQQFVQLLRRFNLHDQAKGAPPATNPPARIKPSFASVSPRASVGRITTSMNVRAASLVMGTPDSDGSVRRGTLVDILVVRWCMPHIGHAGASSLAVRTGFLLTNSWMPMFPSSRP